MTETSGQTVGAVLTLGLCLLCVLFIAVGAGSLWVLRRAGRASWLPGILQLVNGLRAPQAERDEQRTAARRPAPRRNLRDVAAAQDFDAAMRAQGNQPRANSVQVITPPPPPLPDAPTNPLNDRFDRLRREDDPARRRGNEEDDLLSGALDDL